MHLTQNYVLNCSKDEDLDFSLSFTSIQVHSGEPIATDADTSCGSNHLPDLPSPSDKTLPTEKTVADVKGACGDSAKHRQRQFLEAHSTQKIAQMSKWKFAENFEKKICWVFDPYRQWREYRITDFQYPLQIQRSDLSKCSLLSKSDLVYSLTRFVTEVKKLNGENYLP